MNPVLPSIAAACLWAAASLPASAVPAVSGRPVPELAPLDDIMTGYMDDNGITAGVLGLMREGRVVYLRGFGEDFDGNPMPENALVRVASVNKPVTAAMIRKLEDDGELALGDAAFDLGQAGGGVLDCVGKYSPWPTLWDPNPDDLAPSPITTITVSHLLRHRGGWDRGIAGDHIFRERQIAEDLGVVSPPGRVNTIRWILGQPLEFTPGSQSQYSNIGYMALSLIAEELSGQDYVSFARQRLLTPAMWVPKTEFIQGHTFRSWQHKREPRYDDSSIVENVFDNVGSDEVKRPYGGWHQEALIGIGGIVVSAPAMLAFADRYDVGQWSPNIGEPLDEQPLTQDQGHGGALWGTSTEIYQRTDGYRIFVFLNHYTGTDHAGTVRGLVEGHLDNNYIPPIPRTADGFWTEPSGGAGSNVGGYHQPFHSFGEMMMRTTSGSRIRLRPGSSDWTGKITERMRFDAPLGTAKVGL